MNTKLINGELFTACPNGKLLEGLLNLDWTSRIDKILKGVHSIDGMD